MPPILLSSNKGLKNRRGNGDFIGRFACRKAQYVMIAARGKKVRSYLCCVFSDGDAVSPHQVGSLQSRSPEFGGSEHHYKAKTKTHAARCYRYQPERDCTGVFRSNIGQVRKKRIPKSTRCSNRFSLSQATYSDADHHGPSRCEDPRYDIGTDSSFEVEGGGGLVDGNTPYLPYVF